jgi:spore coat polysaccharide biosynthesis predicted glycosyltransferase SpsG
VTGQVERNGGLVRRRRPTASAPGAAPGSEEARIVFRTRAGGRHGRGSLLRLLRLARHLRERGQRDLRFLVEGEASATEEVRAAGFSCLALPPGIGSVDECELLERLPRPDLLVAEMPAFRLRHQRRLRARCETLVIFDDLLDQQYAADLLFCGQECTPSPVEVDLRDGCVLHDGYEHFVLGSGFHPRARDHEEAAPRIERVLVTFGEGGHESALTKTARALRLFERELDVMVALGREGGEGVRQEVACLLPRARLVEVLEEGGEAYRWCDVAITGGGHTRMEAAACGAPALTIATGWHQVGMSEHFAARGGALHLGTLPYVGPGRIVKGLRALDAPELRSSLAGRGPELVDGRGGERVARHLLQRLARMSAASGSGS